MSTTKQIRGRSGSSSLYLSTATNNPFASNTNWTSASFYAVTAATNYVVKFGNEVGGTAYILNGSLAEEAFWKRALTADEIAGLASDFGPDCFPNGLVPGSGWYTPMISDYVELVNNLTITNNDTTYIDHPRIIYRK